MGNLWQENKFRIDGDGIAQWNGGRLNGLLQRGSPRDLSTQLEYIIYELTNTERQANTQLIGSGTVEGATTAFQTYYERCNPAYCMQNQRINYAYGFYERNL